MFKNKRNVGKKVMIKSSVLRHRRLVYERTKREYDNLVLYFNEHFAAFPNNFVNTNKFYIKSFSYMLPKINSDYLDEELLKLSALNNTFDFFKRFNDNIVKSIYNTLNKHVGGNYSRFFVFYKEGNSIFSTPVGLNRFQEFERLFQYKYEGFNYLLAEFQISIYSIPSGGKDIENPPTFLHKRGICLIMNDDDLCGQRCLVYAETKTKGAYHHLRNIAYAKSYENKTKKICEDIGVYGKMSFVDFDKWAELHKKMVVILSHHFKELYTTEHNYTEKIYIYYDAFIEHYHYIKDINALSNDISRNSKWCHSCYKSFSFYNGAFAAHQCRKNACFFCKELFISIEDKNTHHEKGCFKCLKCYGMCANKKCLDVHSNNCKGNRLRCDKCKQYIEKDHYDIHQCGEKCCFNCKAYHAEVDHRCFIQKLPPPKTTGDLSIWCYDFESGFTDDKNHYVNLARASKLFSDERFICYNIEDFVAFVLSKKNTTFIAHNGKAYDTWLVHKHLILHTHKRPQKLILAGNKIMYMVIGSNRFIDSLNHIANKLSKFPEIFGLKDHSKGFFPYLFNIKENADYIGPIPSIEYFSPDEMDTYTRDKFMVWYANEMKGFSREEYLIWYDNQDSEHYDFKKELLEYSYSDVDILKKSMEIYINDGIKLNGINPILSPTIASYALKVYRTNFMPLNKIAILKRDEYDFIRRGFSGGRTEVFKIKASVTPEDILLGRYIIYVDIVSLYPTVQFYDDLPVGIPKWDINPVYEDVSVYLNSHFGYIECDVTPPTHLVIPLLSEKKDFKLMFDLVVKKNAVYTSIELLRAVEIGYTITKIHRSLYFDKSNDLFKGYVRQFLKIKTESAGYQHDDLDVYIDAWYKHAGVMLDKTKIKENCGMKALAKILLNSLWGKFGQKNDLATTEYFTDPAKWFRLLDQAMKGEVEIKTETLIDEKTLYVQYISKESVDSSLSTTNLALAGFVTAQARLRLFKELHQLGERVIYCDTDSIIYHYDKAKYNIEEGILLGQWENEVKSKSPITEVIALSPKSYAYQCADGKKAYKCKGITLNYNNSLLYNFNTLHKLIDEPFSDPIKTKKMEFIKNEKTGVIKTITTDKFINYKPDEFKRVVNPDFSTSPHLENIINKKGLKEKNHNI